MTPGNVEFVQVVASMTVNTGAVAAFLYVDRWRLRDSWREQSWLPATREAAVLGAFLFGWLYGGPALVVHFVKSRWWPESNPFLGLLMGLGCAVTVVAADVAAQLGAAATIDWLGL